MRVGVIGLGMLGGSLAKDLLACGHKVSGYDPLLSTMHNARELGIQTGSKNLAGAEVIFVATPYDVSAKEISRLLKQYPQAIITDLGSLKVPIIDKVNNLIINTDLDLASASSRFVPGHPLTGSELAGFENSRPGLFREHVWALCGQATQPLHLQPLNKVFRLLREIGALPLFIDPFEHDAAMARYSLTPQLLASIMAAGTLQHLTPLISGGAFQDITRVASSRPAEWRRLLIDGRQNLASELRRLQKEIDETVKALEAGRIDPVTRMMEYGQRGHAELNRLRWSDYNIEKFVIPADWHSLNALKKPVLELSRDDTELKIQVACP